MANLDDQDGPISPKAWENTTILMAQELKHRKARVLEGSSVAVGGGGRRALGHLHMRLFLGFSCFSEKWTVGADP